MKKRDANGCGAVSGSPRRVLFVSHESGLAGAERSLLDLVRGIDRNRYEPLVMVPGNGPLKEEMERTGSRVVMSRTRWWVARGRKSRHELKDIVLNMPARVAPIRHLIRKDRIDLVYSNSIACIDGAVAAKGAGVPHIWHVREILSRNREVKPYIPMWMVRFLVGALSTRVIVPSKAVQNDIAGSLPAKKIRVRYNGIDVDRFLNGEDRARRNGFRAEFGIGSDINMVAMVGLFITIKGHLDVVEAARIVCEERKDVVFVFVGGGNRSYRRRVEQRVRELNLEPYFIFLDFRNDIDTVLNGLDILVCASWVESFSRVVCEAMAAGKPVVATRCGGPEELVVDGETGTLVPVRSPEAIAAALLRMLNNPQSMRRMGEKGRDRAMRLFNMNAYIRGIEGILAEIR